MNEAKNLACPECGGILEEVRYPSNSMLNRDQWESCIIGDLYCAKCKPERYYWKSKLAGGQQPAMSKTEGTKHVGISDGLGRSMTIEELEALSPLPLGKRARCVNCTCGNNMYNCRSNRHIPGDEAS